MKKFISAVLSTSLILGSMPFSTVKAEEKCYVLTFLDFDGNYYDSLAIPEGMEYNTDHDVYVDTSALYKHLDVYTEIGFNCWSEGKVTMDSDKVVKALYKKMTISLESQPNKHEYFSDTGAINLDGLKIPISVSTQTRELNENGENIVVDSVTYIESRCSTSPVNLDEAFGEGNNTASVTVYPFHSDKPILTYDIIYFPNLGDANMDGTVDGLDASLVLEIASTKNFSYAEGQKERCDVDRNGIVTSDDASIILSFYADASSCSRPDWEKFFSKK